MRRPGQSSAGAGPPRWGIVVGGAGLAALSALAAVPAASRPPELTVYAAASLREAIQSAGSACEARAGATLVYNFGASNDLARQIVAANKADVFFSADESWMDQVAEAGLVDTDSRRSLLSNRLVVVGHRDGDLRIRAPADLAGEGIRHLALANPEAVPAGKYAMAWLEKAGVWDAVETRVVPGLDVRATLAAVESGGAEAGVVYRTDAAISEKVRILYAVPDAEGPAISYPVAALRDRPHLAESRRLVACLAGPEAADVFHRFGFVDGKDAPRAP